MVDVIYISYSTQPRLKTRQVSHISPQGRVYWPCYSYAYLLWGVRCCNQLVALGWFSFSHVSMQLQVCFSKPLLSFEQGKAFHLAHRPGQGRGLHGSIEPALMLDTSLGRNMADLSGFEPRLCAVAYMYYIYHSSYFAVTSSLSPFNCIASCF